MSSGGASVTANGVLGVLRERAQLAAVYFSDVERAVVKATNRDIVVPKAKHVSTLVSATWEQSIQMPEFFKLFGSRMKETYWAIPFKTLIVIHYLMRQGNAERVMGYLAMNPGVLNVAGFHDGSSGGQGMSQSANVRAYAAYLEERVGSYRDLKVDFVVALDNQEVNRRLTTMKWKEGLHREITVLLRQTSALLICRFYLDSVDNDVTVEAMRLLVQDLLRLSQIVSEAIINMLQQFFYLEKAEATQALDAYRTYVGQSAAITEYLDLARRVQAGLGVDIPELKRAPQSLAKTLQEYLNSPDFEKTRKEYLEKRDAKKPMDGKMHAASATIIDVFSSNAPVASIDGDKQLAVLPQQQPRQPIVPIQLTSGTSPFGDLLGNSAEVAYASTRHTAKQDSFGFAQPASPFGNIAPSAVSQTQNYSTFQRQASTTSAVSYQQQPQTFDNIAGQQQNMFQQQNTFGNSANPFMTTLPFGQPQQQSVSAGNSQFFAAPVQHQRQPSQASTVSSQQAPRLDFFAQISAPNTPMAAPPPRSSYTAAPDPFAGLATMQPHQYSTTAAPQNPPSTGAPSFNVPLPAGSNMLGNARQPYQQPYLGGARQGM